MTKLLLIPLLITSCALWQDAISPSLIECAPSQQYVLDNMAQVLDGQNVFETLDTIRQERGVEFVVCALRGFLQRVSAGPESADQRANARAYLHYLEHEAE